MSQGGVYPPGAEFVRKTLIHNLESQGWLEDAEKWDPCDPTKAQAPDLETLMEWEAEGGCEAVDGCWVEADGTCPHGCPSWLLVMGLI